MRTDPYAPGQRWVSESEPELGLGSVLRVSERTVVVGFGACAVSREYARDNAPLRRVRYRVGDAITDRAKQSFTVAAVRERDGLLFYQGEGGECGETELSDSISFDKPQERLLGGQVDEPSLFDLRLAALRLQHRRRQSQVRGFVGGRIDLIPHQLYIASEASGRLAPRLLLADEVGLGKTIEACLILHRLLLTGRAQRVLILVPEALVHQWFVELLRRFNLWFHIFDEERCASIEGNDPTVNPFFDDQLVLASIGLFSGKERRSQQALAAGWDVVVVDEAHHLEWSPETVSPEYAFVDALGRRAPGLLLLTATPEQFGMAGHFARLRLLDADRFGDLDAFQQEAGHYREVAGLAEKLLKGKAFAAAEVSSLSRVLGEPEAEVLAKLQRLAHGEALVHDEWIGALLDQHGTGRVMLRNTRATIAGFPQRVARLHELTATTNRVETLEERAEEFMADVDAGVADFYEPDFAKDVRIDWLAGLLRELGEAKVLLICRTRRKAEAIEAALRLRLNLKLALFHEGLSLVQRDRQAAWFAEEDGARLLVCSEMGSEGRNFQFAHHLVLFDLPLDPELVEQRIGRLDRIGQAAEIQIHVPFVRGSAPEVMARWYHKGLNALEKNLAGGRELREQFGSRVRALAQDFHEDETTGRAALEQLLGETRIACRELATRLEQGRDRLLEMNSFRAPVAAQLVTEIQRQDADTSLDDFMIQVFDHYGIHTEELSSRTYRVGSAGVFADSFPGLPADGFTATADRRRALAREEVQFLTWDHPLVTGALDLLLGSEHGKSSFAVWPDARVAALYLEAIYLIECVAPPALQVERFLAPTPVRVVVEQSGLDVSKDITTELFARNLRKGDAYVLLDQPEFREDLLPRLLGKAETLATQELPRFLTQARKAMAAQMDHEIARLRQLQKVNRSVRPEEVTLLVEQRRALDAHLAGARCRLEAIRVVQRGGG